ncbi:MAG: phenylacetate-CoA oxygenase subunit PaaI, partial [Gammaproteobacteria bacterium]|nr:phenylacetate-CoA oxygenase subunit PaaI [Gammaproteobacteria bacterium]
MKHKILELTTRLGDDSLVLGHRLSEWCRNAPFLEEDLALINVSLDYIGRARMFYTYAAELADDGRTENDFAYLRDQREFSNLLIHELPKGDFAY